MQDAFADRALTEAAFVEIRDEAGDGTGGVYQAMPATTGPWSAHAQHGGPPSALLVRAAERCARLAAGRVDVVARRYSAEFLGPVPLGQVETTARVVRAGRSAVLVSATLTAGGRACLDARIWLVTAAPTPAVDPVRGAAGGTAGGTAGDTAGGTAGGTAWPSGPADARPLDGWRFAYAQAMQWRMAHGDPFDPGPASAWVRPRIPLIAGEQLSDLQRAVLIGDSASGISSALSWHEWSFANIDLAVTLARALSGEWLFMDAQTIVGPDGTAVTRSLLGDAAGPAGGGVQTLVVRPRS